MRLGCVLVSLALLVSLVVQPPKAKAFALTTGTVAALSGAFLAACGLAPVVSGMSSSGEVSESLARLLQDFLDEKHPGVKDAVEWIGAAALTVTGTGKVMIPKSMAEKLGQFAAWVASKFGMNEEGTVKPGENVVYRESSLAVKLADGTDFLLTEYSGSSEQVLSIGTKVSINSLPLIFASGYYLGEDELGIIRFFDPSGIQMSNKGVGGAFSYLGFDRTNQVLTMGSISSSTGLFVSFASISGDRALQFLGDFTVDKSLALDIAESMQEILERLTALEEGQSIALDVGATQTMEIQDILQGILDAILAGDLTATAEVVDTAELPVDPEEPVVPLPPEGLDELGAALTSRFPFSIPWDVYKGIQLLAAPAKAPYFEVDFLAPIGHLVGGWKGSTKIVLDMSEYEIIGQVSRWASTIGFCLLLASGTKRLIWTA